MNFIISINIQEEKEENKQVEITHQFVFHKHYVKLPVDNTFAMKTK